MKKYLTTTIAMLATVSLGSGAVTITNQWLLGENGALTASVGSVNLTAVGSTTNGAGVASGSTASQSFTNTFGSASPAASNYYTATIGIGSTSNWGVSMWINPTQLANATQGEIGLINVGPINLEMVQGGWMVHDTGVAANTVTSGVPLPSTNTPFQVSYVNENGTARLYVNGVASGTLLAQNSGNNVLIGAMEGNIRGYNGLIDEVSIFTFSTGAFQASDLNNLAPVPEPSVALLGGLGLLGFLARRKRC